MSTERHHRTVEKIDNGYLVREGHESGGKYSERAYHTPTKPPEAISGDLRTIVTGRQATEATASEGLRGALRKMGDASA